MASSEYWATLAQVKPVFAFAVVFRWRVAAKQWTKSPRRYRVMQSSIWVFFTLLALGLAEMAEKLKPNATLVVDDTSPR